jgi:hypothetical protein
MTVSPARTSTGSSSRASDSSCGGSASRAHRFRRRTPERRAVHDQPVDEKVDDAMAKRPHRLGVEREPVFLRRRSRHGATNPRQTGRVCF